jgi:hypothetical protein
LLKSKIFTSLINEIELNSQTTSSVTLKSMSYKNLVIDEIKIEYNNEITAVSNTHLINRVLFSYNNTYQGYINKIKININNNNNNSNVNVNNLYEKVISSHLQASNKTIILVRNHNIFLEFTSYDKKYYNLI